MLRGSKKVYWFKLKAGRLSPRYEAGFFIMADNNSSTGISFTGLLTIAFVVLKLTNYIQWSWWWVLSPIWIPVSIVLIMLLFEAIFSNR